MPSSLGTKSIPALVMAAICIASWPAPLSMSRQASRWAAHTSAKTSVVSESQDDRGIVHQGVDRAGEATLGGQGAGPGNYDVTTRGPGLEPDGAEIDPQGRFARDDVHGARADVEHPDRAHDRHRPRRSADLFHVRHQVGGGGQRVLAKVHRCRARVVGPSLVADLEPAGRGDGSDDPDLLARFLQDAALLNVDLPGSAQLRQAIDGRRQRRRRSDPSAPRSPRADAPCDR